MDKNTKKKLEDDLKILKSHLEELDKIEECFRFA
jgi:hypothetical protein